MNKIIIILEGALVSEVLTEQETEIIIIDYDTEGSDPEDLIDIPQTKGYPVKAHVNVDPYTEVLPERVYELFNAIIGEDN